MNKRSSITTRLAVVAAVAIWCCSAGRAEAQEDQATKGAAASNGQAQPGLQFDRQDDRILLRQSGRPIGEFVFRDRQILRPHFANLRLASGRQVTRNHPPAAGDPTDHADMHPGVWLAFGDLNGSDLWRNKGRIEHVRFIESPVVVDDALKFTTESRLLGNDGTALGTVQSRFVVTERPQGWRLIWEATFFANAGDIAFGDQEEMGFGTRVATAIAEKKGGLIRNSHAATTAKATWGQPAAWSDDSGTIDGAPCGVTLFTAPGNFRESWWHNRDYGLMVANPFGRAAMKQGERSTVTVKPGESLKLVFAAVFHEGAEYDPAREYRSFVDELRTER